MLLVACGFEDTVAESTMESAPGTVTKASAPLGPTGYSWFGGGSGNFTFRAPCRNNTIYIGARVNYTAWRTNVQAFCIFNETANELLTVWVDATNHLVLRRGTTTVLATSTSTIATGTTYHIEIAATIHASTGSFTMTVDGVTHLSYSGNTAGTTPTRPTGFYFTCSATAPTTRLYLDDVYACDDTGTEFNGNLGPVHIELLLPSGNGASSGWTGSDGNSTDNYQLVDEINSVSTDYVQAATNPLTDTYAMADMATTTPRRILAVQSLQFAAKTDAGLGPTLKPQQKLSSDVYTEAAMQAAITYHSEPGEVRSRAPDGRLWSEAKVAALEAGYTAGAPALIPWERYSMLGSDGLHPTDEGCACFAEAIIAAYAAAGHAPTSGQTIYGYGDSYNGADTWNTAGQRPFVQVAAYYGATLTNRAVPGFMVGDCAAYALRNVGVYAPGASDHVIVQVGVNDLKLTDSTAARNAITNYYRALMATLTAASRIEAETAFALTGTWTTGTGREASGDSHKATTVNGSAATYTIATAGDYYLMTHGTNFQNSSLTGGQLTITQGATTLAVVDLDDQAINTINRLTGNYGPLAIPLVGVQTGTLTITFSTLGRGSAQGWLDALFLKATTPPYIMLVKPVPAVAALYQNDSLLQFFRGLVDTMATEFGSRVMVCDPLPGWTP